MKNELKKNELDLFEDDKLSQVPSNVSPTILKNENSKKCTTCGRAFKTTDNRLKKCDSCRESVNAGLKDHQIAIEALSKHQTDSFVGIEDGEPYIIVDHNGTERAFQVGSQELRGLLRNWVIDENDGLILKTRPIKEALEHYEDIISGTADRRNVYTRVALHNRKSYINMANDNNEVIEIDTDGWRIINLTDCPIIYKKTESLLPMLTPIKDGSIKKLIPLMNVRSDEFILLLAWITFCFYPLGEFPILNIQGGKGTGKSTIGEMVKKLIDPTKGLLRIVPKNPEAAATTAHNSWVIVFDNLYKIPLWLQNMLCSFSTGGAQASRKLYHNKSESIIELQRPVILTAVTEIITRGELADRAIFLVAEGFSGGKERKSKTSLNNDFECQAPAILGGILNTISKAQDIYQSMDEVKDGEIRSLDFARWGIAVEIASGFEKGSFLRAYKANINSASTSIIDSDPLAQLIIEYLTDNNVNEDCDEDDEFLPVLGERKIHWLSAKELLTSLECYIRTKSGYNSNRMPNWFPEHAQDLADKLRELAPTFQAIGMVIEHKKKGTGGLTRWLIELGNYQAHQSSSHEVDEQHDDKSNTLDFNDQPDSDYDPDDLDNSFL